MPTVLTADGYRVMVYTRDEHPPAHVHVEKDGTLIKITLSANSVEYHSFKGRTPKPPERNKAEQIVADNLAACWVAWKKANRDNG